MQCQIFKIKPIIQIWFYTFNLDTDALITHLLHICVCIDRDIEPI